MKGKREGKCECGCREVVGVESNTVSGVFDEDGILLLKAGEPLGTKDLKCEACGKEIKGNFEIQFG